MPRTDHQRVHAGESAESEQQAVHASPWPDLLTASPYNPRRSRGRAIRTEERGARRAKTIAGSTCRIDAMKVSVVIPVRNERDTAIALIERVRAVDCGMEKELIV